MKQQMTLGKWLPLAAVFVILASSFGVPSARSQDAPAPATLPTRAGFALSPASTLRLEGDSNVHAWSSTATAMRVKGWIEGMDPTGSREALWSAVRSCKDAGAELHVSVDGLRSGKNKLDANMVKALRGAEHPEIVYRLEKYQVKDASDSLVVALTGSLRVAGKERPHIMTVSMRPDPKGLRVSGYTTLKMTDFGIKPPTMMLGTLRTHDDVVIRIDLVLEPGKGGVK